MSAKLLAPMIFRLSYGLALAAAAATFCYRLVLFIEMFVFSNENDVTISHSATKVYLFMWLMKLQTYCLLRQNFMNFQMEVDEDFVILIL